MGKKHEYQRRGSSFGSSNYQGQKGPGEYGYRRENREIAQNRNYNRDNGLKQGGSSNNSAQPRYTNNKVKTEETIEDIRDDIQRIEKEIELEIKEIRSLKL